MEREAQGEPARYMVAPVEASGTPMSFEEFLVGRKVINQLKEVASRCPEGSDASRKLDVLQATVWSQAKSSLRRHAQGASAITMQEVQNLNADVAALEQTVSTQKSDLQDFQSQLPVVLQSYAPRRRWIRLLYLGGMALASLIFAGVLVPTFEVLVFTDQMTGQPVPGAQWKAALTGFIIGSVLAALTWLASSHNKDINPHNNTKETIIRFLPLFLGLSVAIGIALFRWQQIGFSKTVVGMTVIECAIVGFIEMIAHRYAYRYADEPQTISTKIGDLTRNIDLNLHGIERDKERLEDLQTQLSHQRRAEELWGHLNMGEEASVWSGFSAWTEKMFELYRPSRGTRV